MTNILTEMEVFELAKKCFDQIELPKKDAAIHVASMCDTNEKVVYRMLSDNPKTLAYDHNLRIRFIEKTLGIHLNKRIKKQIYFEIIPDKP